MKPSTFSSYSFFLFVVIVESYKIAIARPSSNTTRGDFTIDELINKVYTKKVSDDLYLDPSKAGTIIGDIAVLKYKDENNNKRITKRAVTAVEARVWEFGIIPYEIDDNLFDGTFIALIKQAMRHWESFTCIRFVERNAHVHDNYIFITERDCGCCSFVGKKGDGVQSVSLAPHCKKLGIIIHELGHAIGFWHEHTRPDRNEHVQIITENIFLGHENNFNKLPESDVSSMGLPYDYESIMHYANNAFAKGNFLDTIVPINYKGETPPIIGQRLRLSDGDIRQANILYKCPACGKTFQANSGEFSPMVYINKKPPPEGIMCEWRITATYGDRILLNITDVDIKKNENCDTNYIEIRDGYWHKSPLIRKICTNGDFRNIIATESNRMWIRYVSRNPEGFKGFAGKFEVVCGGDLFIDSQGNLESPNYPEDYPANKTCIWRIKVPETYQVAIKIKTFDIENHDVCMYDRLTIRDGYTENDPLIKTLCGSRTPTDIISTSNTLYVRFETDESIQKGGFSATIVKEIDECASENHGCEHECLNYVGSYQCKCKLGFEYDVTEKRCKATCGGLIQSENGTLTSPFFPELYPANKSCLWEIRAQVNHTIFLNFTHFDIEGNHVDFQECEYDRLEITSSLANNTKKKHGVFCGSKSPGVIVSEENVLRVRFKSDNNIQKSGFAAVFYVNFNKCSVNNGGCQHNCIQTFISSNCTCRVGYRLHENGKDCKEDLCTHEINSHTGKFQSPNYPNHYPGRQKCFWHFQTKPGHRVRLMFGAFYVEPNPQCAYDYVEFFDGGKVGHNTLGIYCGLRDPPMITSSENELSMIFISDRSFQGRGFWGTHGTLCGGYLQSTMDTKNIYSHVKYGVKDYGRNIACEWKIIALKGYSTEIAFIDFGLEEQQSTCDFDYVEIYDDSELNPLYKKFCGKKIPQKFISYGDELTVRFQSDLSTGGKGFHMVYKGVEVNEKDYAE
ncbi:unnamed protein product [Brassicogethes aeneus]|uniref:Metalloendopeptidase n=1 Tax=Brassicogethes aeneus TaxID=1431903 RepID=A0A9P0BC87_BRAAE|nr:unnamed protein product [Brassicogethes aeneus]